MRPPSPILEPVRETEEMYHTFLVVITHEYEEAITSI
jgi:hypothetical protein